MMSAGSTTKSRTWTSNACGGIGAVPRGRGRREKEATRIDLMGPMVSEPSLQRYRKWYAKLLRLYPRQYRERFGEAMEQTFNDLYRERIKAERGLLTFVLWIFLETSAGIIRENATMLMRWSMKRGPT